jgi:hypothetical protein
MQQASAMGYSDWTAYMESLYPAEELCGDALDEAEDVSESVDLTGDGTDDYRVYWGLYVVTNNIFPNNLFFKPLIEM